MNAAATTEQPPLHGYVITGLTESVAKVGDEVRATGTCDHCGRCIRYVVLILNPTTGHRMGIGTDCANRVGMDRAELRQYLASFYGQRSAATRRAEWEARRAARLEADAAEALQHGEHGSAERYTSGCRCELCRPVAPHATSDRFWFASCRCDECLAAAIAADPELTVHTPRLLIDMATGMPARAKMVDGRYGRTWLVTDEDDNAVAWVKPRPARRSTLVSKGYTEAEVPVLGWVLKTRDGGYWFKHVALAGAPTVDCYGVAL